MDIPDLTKAIASREYSGAVIEYSWFGGFGPGDVLVRLEGDGDCSLKLMPGRPPGPAREYRTHISNSRVHEIFSAVSDTGVLRLVPEERGCYMVDLGRFDITVSVAGKTRDVIFDDKRTVDRPEAFFKAREVILSLSRELGAEFDWSPYAYTTAGSSSD